MHAKPRYRGRHRRPSRLYLLFAGPIVAALLLGWPR